MIKHLFLKITSINNFMAFKAHGCYTLQPDFELLLRLEKFSILEENLKKQVWFLKWAIVQLLRRSNSWSHNLHQIRYPIDYDTGMSVFIYSVHDINSNCFCNNDLNTARNIQRRVHSLSLLVETCLVSFCLNIYDIN